MIGKNMKRVSLTVPDWIDEIVEKVLDRMTAKGIRGATKSRLYYSAVYHLLTEKGFIESKVTNAKKVEKEETK